MAFGFCISWPWSLGLLHVGCRISLPGLLEALLTKSFHTVSPVTHPPRKEPTFLGLIMISLYKSLKRKVIEGPGRPYTLPIVSIVVPVLG